MDEDDASTQPHENCSYENYLHDLVVAMRDRAREAESLRGRSQFDDGRAMAFLEVLTHMQNQAEPFGLDPSKIALAGFAPYKGEY